MEAVGGRHHTVNVGRRSVALFVSVLRMHTLVIAAANMMTRQLTWTYTKWGTRCAHARRECGPSSAARSWTCECRGSRHRSPTHTHTHAFFPISTELETKRLGKRLPTQKKAHKCCAQFAIIVTINTSDVDTLYNVSVCVCGCVSCMYGCVVVRLP